jgi:hypothetical protein
MRELRERTLFPSLSHQLSLYRRILEFDGAVYRIRVSGLRSQSFEVLNSISYRI